MALNKTVNTKGYIGIDLGTTNCVVSYVNDNGDVDCVPNTEDELITPTFLHFKEDFSGKIKTLVGSKAKAMAKEDPDNVVSSFKTLMGSPTVVKSIMNRNITSLECSALMLRYLKQTAEDYLNTAITGAVISVPAYFTETQKDATRVAAKKAGLNVKRILTEPTAGAFYYGVNNGAEEKVVAVYDLGGGTFDISIILIADDTSTVLGAPNGDSKLGGDDIDRALEDLVLAHARKQRKNFKPISAKDSEKLIRICEEAKIELCEKITLGSYKEPVVIHADRIGLDPVELSKEEFEKLIDPLVQRTLVCFEKALADAGVTPTDLDEVVLVGGSSRIPYIREQLEKFLNDPRFTVKYFETYAVDPDLAVGLGCGVYLKYIVENKERQLSDVISKTIGIELEHSIYEPLIEKGRVMPAKKSKRFSNAFDNQTEVVCNIYEGEDKLAKNNTYLGNVTLPIPPGPKNTTEVLVTAKVDKDGVLSVQVLPEGELPKTIKIVRNYVDENSDWDEEVEVERRQGSQDSNKSESKVKSW